MSILNTNVPITISRRMFDPRSWWIGRGKSRRRARTSGEGSVKTSTSEMMILNRGFRFTRQQSRRETTRVEFSKLAPGSMPRQVRRQIARDVAKRAWKESR